MDRGDLKKELVPLLKLENLDERLIHAFDSRLGANEVSLSGRLVFPTPYPATWIAESLVLVDRALRYATRVAEGEFTLKQLRGHRPIPTSQGLLVSEVKTGSLKFILVATDRVYTTLRKKPVALALALYTALQIFGLNPHIEFTDKEHPSVIAPARPAEIDITISITVDGERVQVTSNPPPETRRIGHTSSRLQGR